MVRLAVQRMLLTTWDAAPIVFLGNLLILMTGFAAFLVAGWVSEAAKPVLVWPVCFVAVLIAVQVENLMVEKRLLAVSRSGLFIASGFAALLALAALVTVASVAALADPEAGPGTPATGAVTVLSVWLGLTALLMTLCFAAACQKSDISSAEAARLSVGIALGSPRQAVTALFVLVFLALSCVILLPGVIGMWMFSRCLTDAARERDAGEDLDAQRDRLSRLTLRSVLQPWLR